MELNPTNKLQKCQYVKLNFEEFSILIKCLNPTERFYVNVKSFIALVHAFVSLARILFREGGFTYLLSEKLMQDPPEEYFSKQR